MKKTLRELVRTLRRERIPISSVDSSGRHIKVYLHDGQMFVAAKTPGCRRGGKNFLSDIRKYLKRRASEDSCS